MILPVFAVHTFSCFRRDSKTVEGFFSVVYHFYFCFVILFATFFMNSTCSNTELNNYIYKSISYAGNSLKNLLPPINNVQKTYYSCHWRIHMSRLGPFSLVVSNAAKKGHCMHTQLYTHIQITEHITPPTPLFMHRLFFILISERPCFVFVIIRLAKTNAIKGVNLC